MFVEIMIENPNENWKYLSLTMQNRTKSPHLSHVAIIQSS